MRLATILIVMLLSVGSALALEQPNTNHDAPEYPTLTMNGLEDLQLGQPVPAVLTFPGMSTRAFQEPDYEGSQRVLRTSLKIYHNGFYLGRALLDNQKRVAELEIVNWRVAYQGEFATGSTWSHLQNCLPDVNLHYADMLEALVAESSELPGLQVHFAPASYSARKSLKGEFTPLDLSKLPPHARAQKLRLFWVPTE